MDSSYTFDKVHPLFWIQSKVRTFPHDASQAKKLIFCCTQSSKLSSLGKKLMNPALRLCKGSLLRNCHPSVSNHLTLSSSSKFTIFPPKHNSNLSTSSISQSLKGLENQGLQLPPFSPLAETIQTSLTQASLDATRANKEGKDSHKGVVPHHLSFQKLTL